MLVSLSAIGVLLVLSAFFSGSETALTAASRPLMHQMENNGNRRARIVNRLHQRKGRLIGAILLGNNLVNITASALATGSMIALFGEAGVAYATIVMTLLILIFSEILPKTYAFRYANRLALYVAPVVSAVVFLFAPVTRAIQLILSALLKPFRIDFRADEEALGNGLEELRGAIELHARETGTIAHERAMLRSVLDLAEVQVGEIMIHRKSVTRIEIDQPIEDVVGEVLDSPFTRIPLWRGEPDNIVGVLHVKELLRAEMTRKSDLDALDVGALAAEPWFIPDTTLLLDQLQAFRARRSHFALVVDEYGSLMGIVTLEDILEEIVGDISDEHDIQVIGVRYAGDGSYVVDGNVTIRDLNREFEWGLPDEEAATAAGLVLHESRRIPEVGQIFLFHGLRFEILRRQRNQITALRVTPQQTDPETPQPRK
ncbi:MAG: HlyC/CorC family transporter [Rhodospirillales bacterium]|jgi:Mg2+/Co2+ transporter CorB|nr:HlyC/CorC family transporter [Rhodospirillales bacterium]MDP6805539.1 HlyC/CorC family transporter [Rhodospirillales bacterium]